MASSQQTPLVQLVNISKQFPGVLAVDTVSLDIFPGEVHVVAGENGAGKSTLMKLLSQVERPTSGTVLLNGREVRFRQSAACPTAGHFDGLPGIRPGTAPHRGAKYCSWSRKYPVRGSSINTPRSSKRVGSSNGWGCTSIQSASSQPCQSLNSRWSKLLRRWIVEAKLVIMDEPTATLTDQEIVHLFSVIRGLTAQGIAVFYISHRLDEIFQIADRVTVMRDGKVVATLPRSDLDQQKLIRLMVGRDYPTICILNPIPRLGR